MGLSTRQIPYITATIMLLVGGILFFAFPMRNLMTFYLNRGSLVVIPVVAIVYNVIIYVFILCTFFLASFVDPGIYPRESTDEEDDFHEPLYKDVTMNGVQVRMKWCETCKFYRPPRCSHCSICDNCVENFDHHCPWIDNCVGRRNYKYFLLFITSLTLWILSGFAWAVLSILVYRERLTVVIVEFILLFFGVCVFIPVVGLAGFHIGLVCMGRTTNEHVTGKFRGGHNPYDLGCVRNCLSVLCAPKKPRYMHYQIRSLHHAKESRQQGREGSQAQTEEGTFPHRTGPLPNNDLNCVPLYEELDNHQSTTNDPNETVPTASSPSLRLQNGSELISPTSTSHSHLGGGSEIREITV